MEVTRFIWRPKAAEPKQLLPFPKTYQRRRATRKARTEFGIDEAFAERSGVEQKNGNAAVVVNEVVENTLSKVTEVPNLIPFLPFCSRRERSKRKVARKQMPDPVTEGTECPDPTTYIAHPRSVPRRKVRKRKTKPKDDLSDSEVNFTRRVHVRGYARRDRNTTTEEHGKLDSATLQHYLEHIWSSFPEEKVKAITYFDPLWFHLYSNEKSRTMVLNWMKEKDVFSKAYVFIPIVQWSHWSLLIFCHFGETPHSESNAPCMLLLDSLHTMGPTRLEPLIRRLLFDIYKIEGRLESKQQLKKLPLLIPKVPQQKRGEECGYYVLHYINLFLENAPEKFSISEGYPYFMKKDWFSVDGMESFYRRLETYPKVPPVGDEDADDSASASFLEDSSGVIHVL